jgi:voltage-dependent potassium channel beta subunit
MEYRHLGKSGLKISQFSLGSWVTFGKQVDIKLASNMMAAAKEYGINFFDNAEVYAYGVSEEIMGTVLKDLSWTRLSYMVSTKFFWGITDEVNGKNTLNRKYLSQAIDGSLKRLGLDFVDLVYCHRPDPHTPIEETVWAMHTMIEQGKALYWGTSEWSADEIRAAWDVAERHHLHKPIVEQPQYNLLHRQRVELEYARLYKDIGLGLTTWSPLASGALTGKYLEKSPQGSRLTQPSMSWLNEMVNNKQTQIQIRSFSDLAKELSVSPGNLALAWCSKNANVSSVITGASSLAQLKENMGAVDTLNKLTPEIMKNIDEIFHIQT